MRHRVSRWVLQRWTTQPETCFSCDKICIVFMMLRSILSKTLHIAEGYVNVNYVIDQENLGVSMTDGTL